jgi:hypothetical protein
VGSLSIIHWIIFLFIALLPFGALLAVIILLTRRNRRR